MAAPQKRVNIVHRDGREYSIEPKDFTRANLHPDGVGSYADQGFRIVNHVDGTAYDGPKTKREIEKLSEERAAARQEKPDEKPTGKGKDA